MQVTQESCNCVRLSPPQRKSKECRKTLEAQSATKTGVKPKPQLLTQTQTLTLNIFEKNLRQAQHIHETHPPIRAKRRHHMMVPTNTHSNIDKHTEPTNKPAVQVHTDKMQTLEIDQHCCITPFPSHLLHRELP